MPSALIAIDQGTTSTRAIAFDAASILSLPRNASFGRSIPRPERSSTIRRTSGGRRSRPCASAWRKAGVAATTSRRIGITNQRETTRASGSAHRQADLQRDRLAGPPHRADCADAARSRATRRRSPRKHRAAARSIFLRQQDRLAARQRRRRTRERRKPGELAFGTIDSFLLWRLTGGSVHATDATNASRTLLFEIARGGWDERAAAGCSASRMRCCPKCATARPSSASPTRRCSAARFAIRGIAGDQQAATIGHGCFRARHDEIHLRHRLLRGSQHRRGARDVAAPAAHDHRLSARRQAHLCARRRDLRRRCSGAVAARRARVHSAAR